MNVVSMLNYDYSAQKKQPLGGVSLTVPDQNMTVRELLNRYARGLPLGGQKVEIYDGDEEYFPDSRTLDLSEIEDIKNEATELFDKVKTEQDAKAKKREADRLRELHRKEFESEQAPSPPGSDNVTVSR